MASRRIMVTMDEDLAKRVEDLGISFSELIQEAARERVGDRKHRPLAKRVETVEGALVKLNRRLAALEG